MSYFQDFGNTYNLVNNFTELIVYSKNNYIIVYKMH